MKQPMLGFLCVGLAAASASAWAHGPHVHGTGELNLAIQDNTISMELYGPLINVLGFEHAPRTDAQRAAVKAMVATLNNPTVLFVLPEAAACKAGIAQIDSPLTPSTSASSKSASKSAKDDVGDDDGNNLTADFEFTCEHIENATTLTVKLFDAFPNTHIIKAAVVGPHGQSAKTLTTDDRSLPL